MKMEIQHCKIYGTQPKYFFKGSLQQYRPTSGNKKNLKKSNIIPKGTIKRKAKPKVSRRKEIIKIREEINKIEIQKTIEKKSIKPRAGSLKR